MSERIKFTISTVSIGLLAALSHSCGGSVVGAPCEEEYSECKGGCFNLSEDEQHCGSCETSCKTGEICIAGACNLCPIGTTECYGKCVDIDTDRNNCGACGNECGKDEICEDGRCVLYCEPPLVICYEECVDIDVDENNCGECGNVCDTDEVCIDGVCELVCKDSLIECNDICIDPQIDRNNCGECFVECSKDEICKDGECIPDCGLLTWCVDECVDLESNNQNCGECENQCDKGWYCVYGKCNLECTSPLVPCGEVCADLTSDPLNCGKCFNECASGICDESSCRSQSAGHLVAIGHDFQESHTVLHQLIGNAIFMASTNPVEVLAYVEFADETANGQVAKVDAAISARASALGRSWTKTRATSTGYINDNLLNYDALLVYVQKGANNSELNAVGNNLFTILNSFLSVGGIIVFTDAVSTTNSGTFKMFDSADLFSCTSIRDISNTTVRVIDSGDAVAQGTTTTYMATKNSVYFNTYENNIVVEYQNTGRPVIVHKIFVIE